MAYTKYTGKDMAVTFNSITLEGIESIELSTDGAPLPEMMDTTVATASAYEFTADPLGGRGTAKTSVRVNMFDNKVGYTDSKLIKQTMGTSASLLVQPFGTTEGRSKFTITARLQERRTTLSVRDWTKIAATFEADDDGAWDSN